MRLHWIDTPVGRLATSPAPSGSAITAEVERMAAEGVEVVASCLEVAEADSIGLANEGSELAAVDIGFVHHPVPDFGVPVDAGAADATVRKLADLLRAERSVVVHCRGGIGRASTIAACVLVELGVDPEVAMDRISAARGMRVPETQGQRMWVLGYSARQPN
ncbi:MAG: protein-tyrosine phosphatase [Candidatus Poriferisodalaceae bacterium]|jgi:protein-tyrosine phosphatase